MTHRLATYTTLALILLVVGCGREPAPPTTAESPFDDSPISDTTEVATTPVDETEPIPATTEAATTPAPEKLVYSTGFEDFPEGPLDMESITVLNGDWRVESDTTGKYLVLPGEPLRDMGLLIGPDLEGSATVSARIMATAKGRTKPRFGVGLNGANGYVFRVALGSRTLELVKNGSVVASGPFRWEAGRALRLQLTMTVTDAGCEIAGTATTADGETTFTWRDQEIPFGGQAAIYGTPYSGTPIHFDDIRITQPE